MPYCNANAFQLFLDELSKQNPGEYKIIVLDNGASHKAKALIIPDIVVVRFRETSVRNIIRNFAIVK